MMVTAPATPRLPLLAALAALAAGLRRVSRWQSWIVAGWHHQADGRGLCACLFAVDGARRGVTRLPGLPSRFVPEVSHEIERLAARAWPADEVEVVEGWLLRRTVGVDRRRSNSMLPPGNPGEAARTVEVALATAEELGFAEVIQVSPAEGHRRLDEELEARGFGLSGASLVLAGGVEPVGPPASGAVQLGELTHEWVTAWAGVSGLEGTAETAELVLSQLGDRARFATALDPSGGEVAGTGIGVAEEGWVGLFSLAVAPSARRRRVGSAIVDALLSWSADRGARRAYLQVEADNAGALAFYGRRGFFIAHSYHYRSA
jgi:N-acetylglutamate synthase